MTFQNNAFHDFLINNGFSLRKTNNNNEPSHQYRLYQKDDIWLDFFAGWCTIDRKNKRLYDFELCTDRDQDSEKFQYKEIPKKIIKFLISLPDIKIPDGVILLMDKDISRSISKELRLKVMQKCNYKCVECHSEQRLCIDHIFPISKGGPTIYNNLQVLCRSCNLKKSNKLTLI